MNAKAIKQQQRMVEICLIIISVALVVLLARTVGYKMIVLNLFYLPVVLAAFFLGRYRAGVLALFSVIAVFAITVVNIEEFTASSSPILIALAITAWGAVLGLTAIIVGTLSDERNGKISELHEAYVGVVEVLSGYLQNANPHLKSRTKRIAELSQRVAERMKLSSQEIDEIRVAALLHDMANVEITTKVIRKAVGNLEADEGSGEQHTFEGTELAHSLGNVLTGAIPIMLSQCDATALNSLEDGFSSIETIPVGAQIIRTVRAYESLRDGAYGMDGLSPSEVINDLREDTDGNYSHAILTALEKVEATPEATRNIGEEASEDSLEIAI